MKRESNQLLFVVFELKTEYRLQDILLQNGIQTVIHYPVPPHNQKALSFEPFVFPLPKKFMMKY
jgi:hypothetical protein